MCVLRLRRGSSDDAYVGRATLIVSHGNALDAALFVPFASHLAHQLDANVSVYDYSGYGRSSGAPRVEDCKADIEAVVRHHVERLGCDPARIVLYGQSIGSGPTCHYAALAGRASRGSHRESGNNPTSTSVDGERSDPRKRLNATPTAAAARRRRRRARVPDHVRPERDIAPGRGSGGARCTPACVYKSCDVFKNFQAVGSFEVPGARRPRASGRPGAVLARDGASRAAGGCRGGSRTGGGPAGRGGGNIAHGFDETTGRKRGNIRSRIG